jgi:hypothetical protein
MTHAATREAGADLSGTPQAQVPGASSATAQGSGHVLLAMQTLQQRNILITALTEDGWQDDDLSDFAPREGADELAALLGRASSWAGFAEQQRRVRRYLQLVREGHCWLLVRVESDAEATRVGQLARLYGASEALRYRLFVVEELM